MSINFNIPYSAQYNTINREGHEHPPPSFGAPTLVWHLAVSPHWREKQPNLHDSLATIHDDLAKNYEETRVAFFEEVNRLLDALQRTGRLPTTAPEAFDPQCIPDPWQARQVRGNPFYITSPGSIRFTLWWGDADTRPSQEPTADALRVNVHASAHRDYVTLSFYLDVTKPWNEVPFAKGSEIQGDRRKRILSEVDRVRSICQARMVPDSQGVRLIDHELLPERGVSSSDAANLLSASRFLYGDIWQEFCKAMNVNDIPVMETGRIFANFRGLIMSTDGLPEIIEERSLSGAGPFPRFKGNGGIDHTGTKSSDESNEANAVVKAFWPFIRRATPDADRKEFVACGVMSWRALYVTSLNCPPTFEWQEEARSSDTDIPADNLPDASNHIAAGPKGEDPVRYLLITKGEPHRPQVGRIIDRINSMGTMRLIALRDYSIIRDASTQIQLRGLELDTMMRKWSIKRSEIRSRFEPRKRGLSGDKRRSAQDEEDEEIQTLADDVEKDLIELSAALDEIGIKAVHGLHFRINRSRYYVAEFESLLASLKVGNIDTWVSYEQFVARGLKPAFDFIDGLGHRLLGLRTRLQSVLEGIETSALVKQSSATRQNTMHLRRIADSFYNANFWLRILGLTVALLSTFIALFGLEGVLKGIIGWVAP